MKECRMKMQLASIVVFCICVTCMPAVAQRPCGPSDTENFTTACINQEKLLTYSPSYQPTAEQAALLANIMSLDHRAHEQLGQDTPEWREVLGMLYNAANLSVEIDFWRQAYNKAEEAFFGHIEAKNRIKYLVGLILGVIV